MKSFKGTIFFAIAVAAIVAFAIFEFKKGEEEKKAEAVAGHLLKNLQPETVTEFTLKADTEEIKLAQTESQWAIVSPIQDFSDDEIVENFLVGVATQTIEEVPMDGTIDWVKYGLDKPQYELNLKTKDKRSEFVQFSRIRTFNEGFYVRLNTTNALFVAPKNIETHLSKNPNDFRSRRLHLPPKAWTQLSIESKKAGNVFKTTYEVDKGNWAHKTHKEWALVPAVFDDYARHLKDLKASEIVTETKTPVQLRTYGLHSPELKIQVSDSEKQTEINFSKAESGFVHFTATDSPGIYKIATSSTEALFKADKDFRDKKFPFAFDTEKVMSVYVQNGKTKKTSTLKKEGMAWTAENLQPGESVKNSAVDEFIKGIRDLEIADFPTKTTLGRTESAVELKGMGGEPLVKLMIGTSYKNKETPLVYVVTQASKDVYGISQPTLQGLLDKNLTEVVTDKKEK